MISTQYTCLEMPGISSKEQLLELLRVYADLILQMSELAYDSPYFSLKNAALSLERDTAIHVTVQSLLTYITIEDISSVGASLIVEAQYEGDADNFDLCKEISKFLFSKTSNLYFLMRSAATDKIGSYSHQWVGFWKDDEVVVQNTAVYFDQLFGVTTDHSIALAIWLYIHESSVPALVCIY